jgi:phage terminase small subunit
VRTKSQRGCLPNLVNVGNKQAASDANAAALKQRLDSKKVCADYSPKAVLLSYIQELVGDAAKNGDASMSPRVSRKLERMMVAYVDVAAKDILHSALEKFAAQNEKYACEIMDAKVIVSPEKAMSSTIEVVTPSVPEVILGAAAALDVEDATNASHGGDDYDDEDDLKVVTVATTVDDFISEMNEEVVLQTLLHKRVYEKKERVFQLEHRNGRRLLVVLPPDTRSISTFVDEATKTSWVDIMLNLTE